MNLNRDDAWDIIDEARQAHELLYVGGPEYFDNFDKWIRDSGFLLEFVELLVPTHPHLMNAIVSGRFGRALVNLADVNGVTFRTLVLVNGSLRDLDSEVDDISYLARHMAGKRFDFIDDSFYSGKTRAHIRAALNRVGATLECTHVIYDGSLVPKSDVKSLYRYHKGK